eukprot:gene4636-92_t
MPSSTPSITTMVDATAEKGNYPIPQLQPTLPNSPSENTHFTLNDFCTNDPHLRPKTPTQDLRPLPKTWDIHLGPPPPPPLPSLHLGQSDVFKQ